MGYAVVHYEILQCFSMRLPGKLAVLSVLMMW